MVDALFVTVGGSPDPICTAITTLRPRRVVYICSGGGRGSHTMVTDGDGSILARLGRHLDESDGDRMVVLDDPDDLGAIVDAVSSEISNVLRSSPDDLDLAADYTGGTKSMSVGLAMAAVRHRIPLYVARGHRKDLVKITHGELTARAPVEDVWSAVVLEPTLADMIAGAQYQAAARIVRRMAAEAGGDPELARLLNLVEGLACWDRFDHHGAARLLQPFGRALNQQVDGVYDGLLRVLRCRAKLEGTEEPNGLSIHGAELVDDLLANAARRAALGRYDDAVGRVYRAFEAAAQARLWFEHGIATARVPVDRLPDELRRTSDEDEPAETDAGHDKLGAVRSYDLLAHLGDELGSAWRAEKDRLLGALDVRNHSLFAHGYQPIDGQAWRRFDGVIGDFLRAYLASQVTDRAPALPLLPTSLDRLKSLAAEVG